MGDNFLNFTCMCISVYTITLLVDIPGEGRRWVTIEIRTNDGVLNLSKVGSNDLFRYAIVVKISAKGFGESFLYLNNKALEEIFPNVTNFDIGDGITDIDYMFFAGHTKIKHIYLGKDVHHLPTLCLMGVSDLKSFTFSFKTKWYDIAQNECDDNAFWKINSIRY